MVFLFPITATPLLVDNSLNSVSSITLFILISILNDSELESLTECLFFCIVA